VCLSISWEGLLPQHFNWTPRCVYYGLDEYSRESRVCNTLGNIHLNRLITPRCVYYGLDEYSCESRVCNTLGNIHLDRLITPRCVYYGMDEYSASRD